MGVLADPVAEMRADVGFVGALVLGEAYVPIDAKKRAAERMARMFAQAGISRERVTFLPGGPHREFLAQYASVDVILDTTPYSGGLTTCEALWQGVPTVTLTGERFCGRHSTSHLRT